MRGRTIQNKGFDFITKRGKFQCGSFISLAKIKFICYRPTKYLLPNHYAKLLPTSRPPFPHDLKQLPRSLHTFAELTLPVSGIA